MNFGDLYVPRKSSDGQISNRRDSVLAENSLSSSQNSENLESGNLESSKHSSAFENCQKFSGNFRNANFQKCRKNLRNFAAQLVQLDSETRELLFKEPL